MKRAVLACVVGLWALSACGEGDAEPVLQEPVTLIDFEAFTETSEDNDPFLEHRPTEVRCSNFGYEDFGGRESFEVDTASCNYLTAVQPSLAPISPGDELSILLWHYELKATEPATAHVAIQVGHRLVWETTVAIPADSGVDRPTVPLDFSAPEGTPVYFHLHNHGENAWSLLKAEVQPR